MIKRFHKDTIPVPFLYLALLFTAISVVIFSLWIKISVQKIIIQNNNEKSVEYDISIFENAQIVAKSYSVYDIVDKKFIVSRNGMWEVPLASLTKIMTAVTSLGSYSTSTKITIENSSIDGDIDLGLVRGQVWSLEELLKYTLIFSSNDGAQAIADNLGGRKNFIGDMNNKSEQLGLSLRFTDPSGLDKNGLVGGKGSAQDVALLFSYARKEFPDILDVTSKSRGTFFASNGSIIGIPNTNQSIENIVGSESSKTGFTDEAGGNLVIVTDITLGHPIVIVVLGSTKEGRFSDVKTLYNLTKKSIR